VTAELNQLDSIADLDFILEESDSRPVLLFKHSVTCPISARAFQEFESYLSCSNPKVSYNLITVQTSQPVSAKAAERLGVKHESPQAILICKGRAVWNASHLAITASALEKAIAGTDL
jgi:monothiol bacilliredoxin